MKLMLIIKRMALIAGWLAVSTTVSQATLYVVPGTADPWLAGVAPGGFDPSNGSGHDSEPADVAPNQSPVQVTDAGIITFGNTIVWTATGEVGHPGDKAGPDGNPNVSVTRYWGAQNGIPDIGSQPICALLGVFTGTTPVVFVMGSSGSMAVPAGATGFYMGTMDGFGWKNNIGEFEVKLMVVPEPTTCIAGALLLLPFGWSTLRRMRKSHA